MLLNAQSFIFSTTQTTRNGGPLSEIIFPFLLKNISSDTITLDFVRQGFSVPQGWTCNLCFDVSCFAAFVDSIATNEDFNSSPLAPGETRDVSVHFFTSPSPGAGNCTVYMKNRRNPADKISITLNASTLQSGIEEKSSEAFSVSAPYPLPASGSVSFAVSSSVQEVLHCAVYDLTGRIISSFTHTKNAGKEIITIPVASFAQGVYYVTVNCVSGSAVKQLLVQGKAY